MSIAAQPARLALIPGGTWNVDPGHSTVEFEVVDMDDLIATIKGRFLDFEGTITPDEVRGVIRTESLTTGHAKRDQHLRSPDFLDAAAHPEIRFASSSVEHVGDETFRIAGTLTIKGLDHEVELEATLRGAGRDRFGNERLSVRSAGELPWGPTVVKLAVDVSAVKAG